MSCCPLASPDRPAIEAVLFDLDDTLYRIEAIPERVRENIEGESFFFLCSLFFFLADLNFFSLLFLSLSLTHTHSRTHQPSLPSFPSLLSRSSSPSSTDSRRPRGASTSSSPA